VAVTVDWLVSSVVHWSHGGRDGGVHSVVGNWVDGVSNDWGSVDGVSNDWGSVDGVSNGWGSVDGVSNDRGSVDGVSHDWGSVDGVSDNGSWLVGRGGLVSRGRGGHVRLSLGVDSGSFVGHLGNIAVIAVGGVGHLLDSAVGESHGVGALDIAGTIGGLLGVEVGLGVVVSHGVGEGVRGNLIRVLLGLVSGGGGGSVGGGGLHNHGGDHRGGGVSWGGVDSVGNGMNSVVGNGVDGVVSDGVNGVVGDGGDRVERDDSGLASWHDLVGSNGGLDLRQTLGVVHLADGGVSGSECLGLDQTSLLSMGGGD